MFFVVAQIQFQVNIYLFWIPNNILLLVKMPAFKKILQSNLFLLFISFFHKNIIKMFHFAQQRIIHVLNNSVCSLFKGHTVICKYEDVRRRLRWKVRNNHLIWTLKKYAYLFMISQLVYPSIILSLCRIDITLVKIRSLPKIIPSSGLMSKKYKQMLCALTYINEEDYEAKLHFLSFVCSQKMKKNTYVQYFYSFSDSHKTLDWLSSQTF